MGNEILFYHYDYDGCNFKDINCYKRCIKKKYYTWSGRVVAIWLRYAESTYVGVFFVHLAPAHLQTRNITWSLVI